MTDTLIARARRVLSAGVEDAMTSIERANSNALLREMVRQAARTAQAVERERDAMRLRRSQADVRRKAIAKEIETLGEHARYALSQQRTDLAERALRRQVELETEAMSLPQVIADADAEGVRLDAALVDLRERHARMRDELAAFEALAVVSDTRMTELDRKIADVERSFERAMAAANGARGDTNAADIATLRQNELVAARLSALQSEIVNPTPKPKRKRVAR